MAKGIIVLDDIPQNCFWCKFKKRPFGFSFEEDMICGIMGKSVYKYKPYNICGNKPDWCPIKETGTSAYLRLFEQKEIRTKVIKMVREIVGAVGMMDCKKALERNNWDITRTIEYLISHPLSPAIKRG